MSCFILGDSIAVGLALLASHCGHDAKVGLSSTAISRMHVPAVDTVIISAGSNDARNPRLADNLIKIRSKVKGRAIWILPANFARGTVDTIGASYGERRVSFTPARDGIHPKSYKALYRKVFP